MVAIGLLPAGLLAACELAEVGTAPGEDIVVVEAILRAGASRQVVLLHHTLEGDFVDGEPGADVRVTGPGGAEARLLPANLSACADRLGGAFTDSTEIHASCYVAPTRALDVRPGDTYELRISTLDGREIRGRTTVPGAFEFHGLPRVGTGYACAIPPRTTFPLAWSVASGAWSYLAGMEIGRLREALAGTGITNPPDRIELTGAAISERDTTFVVPSEIGVFELGSVDQEILKLLQGGFPAGVSVVLSIAAVDRNYVNAVRGGRFNPSGNVRLSSVVGDGVGVFGSLVARELEIQVGNDLPLPPCGPG